MLAFFVCQACNEIVKALEEEDEEEDSKTEDNPPPCMADTCVCTVWHR